jgi:hypothetical protein
MVPGLRRLLTFCAWLAAVGSSSFALPCLAGELSVSTDFEGGSAEVVSIDQTTRTIHIRPAGDPQHGWPCWWYFRVDGIDFGETLTIEVSGSERRLVREGPNKGKLLAAGWSLADRANYSVDGKAWLHTSPAAKEKGRAIYRQKVDATTAWFAWGPPFTPHDSAELCKRLAEASEDAEMFELCQSREGRPCPALRVLGREGTKPEDRPAVWIHARQHAWESGSSWVCRGLAEWVTSDDPPAVELRRQAELFIVPIMDIDHTATGQGGKESIPQDHNRDWTDKPHWNEVAAAQARLTELSKSGRLSLFIDLHNPGPNDRQPFFYISPDKLLSEEAIKRRDQFLVLARAEITGPLPLAEKPKVTDENYDPLWQQMSKNWVAKVAPPDAVAVCLETSWNTPASTTEGYLSVGEQLGRAVARYVAKSEP